MGLWSWGSLTMNTHSIPVPRGLTVHTYIQPYPFFTAGTFVATLYISHDVALHFTCSCHCITCRCSCRQAYGLVCESSPSVPFCLLSHSTLLLNLYTQL